MARDIVTVGLVVNPKLKKPVFVAWNRNDSEIEIWSLERKGQRIGLGTYETDDPTYLAAAEVTGLPRVHTPSGVSPKGKGYGTTLYTGLCLGAHLHSEQELDLDDVDQDGDGVSSDSETRSASADVWWRRAKDLGLADQVEEERTQEDVEFDESDLSCEHSEGNVYISYARGDLTTEIVADAFYYQNADNADLIIASFSVEMSKDIFMDVVKDEKKWSRYLRPSGLRTVWKEITEDDSLVHEIEIDPLLALDVRGLDPQAVNLLSALAAQGGAKDDDIDALRMRAELNLDRGQQASSTAHSGAQRTSSFVAA